MGVHVHVGEGTWVGCRGVEFLTPRRAVVDLGDAHC